METTHVLYARLPLVTAGGPQLLSNSGTNVTMFSMPLAAVEYPSGGWNNRQNTDINALLGPLALDGEGSLRQ